MKSVPGNMTNPLGESSIAAQFEGLEIEFDDKATLFPVQVEKNQRPRRSLSRGLRRSKR